MIATFAATFRPRLAMRSHLAAWAHERGPTQIAWEAAMEHLLSMATFAAVIAAQFLAVVFAAAMGGDARPWKGRLSRYSRE